MKTAALILSAFALAACATNAPFTPRSDYPPDPWVKGYANDDDCIGGEDLAAMSLDMPDYPRASYRAGRQGWVIVRLDVDAAGVTQNIAVERSVPEGRFSKSAVNAVRDWRFEPPKNGGLSDCRVLLRYRLGGVTLGG
ncbi:energy transducer TonB [Robiginitomaculum antarcticum]|uniref:energy transducer TonB n=1 Tax=Robiginitomaculum antarcticum TaxID=437507 RepID=UPI00037EDFC7|nr:TonB family protein [Robiginitomaculum antarcticum]